MRIVSAFKRWRQTKWYRSARVLALVAFCAALVYHGSILYRLRQFNHTNPTTTVIMEQRAQQASAKGVPFKKDMVWTPIEQISPVLIRAVVAAEDWRFFQHHGVDFEAIDYALEVNWREKRFVRGASTIHQQLIKNLFLSPSKNPVRKVHEALLACEMRQMLSDRRVLELYLNLIEWGEGVYGAEAAARHYFGIPASSLTRKQAIFLAAIIPHPLSANDPATPSAEVRARMNEIRSVLYDAKLDNPLLGPAQDAQTTPPPAPGRPRAVAGEEEGHTTQ